MAPHPHTVAAFAELHRRDSLAFAARERLADAARGRSANVAVELPRRPVGSAALRTALQGLRLRPRPRMATRA